jgi:ribosomal protein S18 acetylase RimI-like enzyme
MKGACMEVSIHRATSEDYKPLCALFDEVDDLHRRSLPHLFKKPDGPARGENFIRDILGDENVCLLIAESNEKLIGFVHAAIQPAPSLPIFRSRNYAVVQGIGVGAEFRKLGVGRLLMDKVEEWALARGVSSIELNVYEFNRTAITFYERLGYETLSRKMSKTLDNQVEQSG